MQSRIVAPGQACYKPNRQMPGAKINIATDHDGCEDNMATGYIRLFIRHTRKSKNSTGYSRSLFISSEVCIRQFTCPIKVKGWHWESFLDHLAGLFSWLIVPPLAYTIIPGCQTLYVAQVHQHWVYFSFWCALGNGFKHMDLVFRYLNCASLAVISSLGCTWISAH